MGVAAELTRLRAELKSAGSPLERLKIVARAWRTVRRLDRPARLALAREVGSEGAAEIIERLAERKGRLNPAMLLHALERLRGTDLGDLRDLYRGLRDPRRRQELVADGLARWLDDGDGERPVEATAPAPREADGLAPGREAAALEPPGDTSRDPSAAAAPAPPRAGGPAPPEPPPPAIGRPATFAPPRRSAPPRAEKPPPSAGPSPAPPRVAPPDPTPASRPTTAAPAASSRGALWRRVSGASRLLDRLRIAREGLASGRHFESDELRELLEIFPQSWARRRLLSAMFRLRLPDDPAVGASLLSSLDSPAARRWCAAVLAREFDLSRAERERLLVQAATEPSDRPSA